MQNAFQIAAWLALLAIEILSISPAYYRPVLGPHAIEHAAAFFVLGALFAAGYDLGIRTALVAAVMITGAIELSQMLVSGRHARVSDFIIDATGAIGGILVARFAMRRRC